MWLYAISITWPATVRISAEKIKRNNKRFKYQMRPPASAYLRIFLDKDLRLRNLYLSIGKYIDSIP